ncbi:MAG: hypothetical protein DRN54_04285 [Thaumarchaeota archaeon]|nr:MAG: hypothetical protein DRN54_04285 [Nitrososphaerota archaeon]
MSLDKDIERMSEEAKRYLEISEEDVRRAHELGDKLLKLSEKMISGALNSLLSSELASEIIKESGITRERAAEAFAEWLRETLKGDYDLEHAKRVFTIGLAHARHGVHRRLMCLCAGAWLRELLKALKEAGEPIDSAILLSKLLVWNLVLMLHGYHVARRESLKRASGISPALFERLFRLKADEVYRSMRERVGRPLGSRHTV